MNVDVPHHISILCFQDCLYQHNYKCILYQYLCFTKSIGFRCHVLLYTFNIEVHSKISKLCIFELDVSPQKSHSNPQWYVQISCEKIKINKNKKIRR